MTTLNIPSSPSQGATYEANGVVYTWDGTKWKADSSYVSNLNGGPLAGFRNQIINGDFRVWQRGINIDFSNSTTIKYGADRWRSSGSTTANSKMVRSGSATTQSNGVTSSADLIDIKNVACYIELERKNINSQFSIGSTWTQSFYTDQDIEGSSAPNVRFRILTSASGYSTNWIIAADTTGLTWQKGPGADKGTLKHYYFTFTISGNASAGVGNGADVMSLGVQFPGIESGTAKITYCQLEPGPVATPFEHRPMAIEFALCQRYYQTLSTMYLPKVNDNSNLGNTSARTVQMRTDPSESATPAGSVTGLVLRGTAEKWHISAASGSGSSTWQVSNIIADAEL